VAVGGAGPRPSSLCELLRAWDGRPTRLHQLTRRRKGHRSANLERACAAACPVRAPPPLFLPAAGVIRSPILHCGDRHSTAAGRMQRVRLLERAARRGAGRAAMARAACRWGAQQQYSSGTNSSSSSCSSRSNGSSNSKVTPGATVTRQHRGPVFGGRAPAPRNQSIMSWYACGLSVHARFDDGSLRAACAFEARVCMSGGSAMM